MTAVRATQPYPCPAHDVPTAGCCHYCPTCDAVVTVCPHDYDRPAA
jgi:hypothetical protein